MNTMSYCENHSSVATERSCPACQGWDIIKFGLLSLIVGQWIEIGAYGIGALIARMIGG